LESGSNCMRYQHSATPLLSGHIAAPSRSYSSLLC
jgi:hypothetical protein